MGMQAGPCRHSRACPAQTRRRGLGAKGCARARLAARGTRKRSRARRRTLVQQLDQACGDVTGHRSARFDNYELGTLEQFSSLFMFAEQEALRRSY